MAASFFTGTDAELATGSAAFLAQITSTPTAFGLVAADATAYGVLDATWQDAYAAANNMSTRTKGQVAAKNSAREAVIAKAVQLALRINSTPTVTDQQKIDLGLNVRATPSPVAGPGTATDFKAVLMGNGMLEIGWRCQNPKGARGTMYQVWRRTTPEGAFEALGATGVKKWVDATIPAGTSQVTYQVRAIRSTAAGAWAEFNVNFGMGNSGVMTASVTETSPKLAA